MKFSISGGCLKITFSGIGTFLAIKHSLKIPLKHIKRVHTKRPKTVWNELRVPGSFLPGIVKAGNFYTPRGREMWFSLRNSKPLVIELRGEKYKRIVLGVDDTKWVRRISAAIK